MAVHNGPEAKSAVGGGLIAGIVGGFVIEAFLLLVNLLEGGNFWATFKFAGAPFMGERAMAPGFDALAIVVGLFCHFAVAAVWGMLFGLLFHGLTRAGTLLAGAFWGIVVWLGMYYLVLPLVGLGEVSRAGNVLLPIVSHVLFGVTVAAAYLPYQRQVPRMRRMPTPTG